MIMENILDFDETEVVEARETIEKCRERREAIDQSEAFKQYKKLKAELRKAFDKDKLGELRKAANMISAYGAIQRDLDILLVELQEANKGLPITWSRERGPFLWGVKFNQ